MTALDLAIKMNKCTSNGMPTETVLRAIAMLVSAYVCTVSADSREDEVLEAFFALTRRVVAKEVAKGFH
jgi:hypothetical protein